jgi:hypothetical protein
MYACVHRLSAYTYISIYVYTIFLKNVKYEKLTQSDEWDSPTQSLTAGVESYTVF